MSKASAIAGIIFAAGVSSVNIQAFAADMFADQLSLTGAKMFVNTVSSTDAFAAIENPGLGGAVLFASGEPPQKRAGPSDRTRLYVASHGHDHVVLDLISSASSSAWFLSR